VVDRLEKCLQITYASIRRCGKRGGDKDRQKLGSMRAWGSSPRGRRTFFRHGHRARRMRRQHLSDGGTSTHCPGSSRAPTPASLAQAVFGTALFAKSRATVTATSSYSKTGQHRGVGHFQRDTPWLRVRRGLAFGRPGITANGVSTLVDLSSTSRLIFHSYINQQINLRPA
jgi:hypothetical protein